MTEESWLEWYDRETWADIRSSLDLHFEAMSIANKIVTRHMAIMQAEDGQIHKQGAGAHARAAAAYALNVAAEAYGGTRLETPLLDAALFAWPAEYQQFGHHLSPRERLLVAAAFIMVELRGTWLDGPETDAQTKPLKGRKP